MVRKITLKAIKNQILKFYIFLYNHVQSYKAKQIFQLLKWHNNETITNDNTDVNEYFVYSLHLVEIDFRKRVSHGQLKHFCQAWPNFFLPTTKSDQRAMCSRGSKPNSEIEPHPNSERFKSL